MVYFMEKEETLIPRAILWTLETISQIYFFESHTFVKIHVPQNNTFSSKVYKRDLGLNLTLHFENTSYMSN